MKKIITLFILAIMTFTLCSCTESKRNLPSTTADNFIDTEDIESLLLGEWHVVSGEDYHSITFQNDQIAILEDGSAYQCTYSIYKDNFILVLGTDFGMLAEYKNGKLYRLEPAYNDEDDTVCEYEGTPFTYDGYVYQKG